MFGIITKKSNFLKFCGKCYETVKRQWVLNPAELRSEGLKLLDQVKLQNDEVRKSVAEFFNRDRYVQPRSEIDGKQSTSQNLICDRDFSPG